MKVIIKNTNNVAVNNNIVLLEYKGDYKTPLKIKETNSKLLVSSSCNLLLVTYKVNKIDFTLYYKYTHSERVWQLLGDHPLTPMTHYVLVTSILNKEYDKIKHWLKIKSEKDLQEIIKTIKKNVNISAF